jgi:hypothetical protein
LTSAADVKRAGYGDLEQSLEALTAALLVQTVWHPIGR